MRLETSPSGIAAFMDPFCEALPDPMAGQFVASSKAGDEGRIHLQYLEAPNVGILLLSGSGRARGLLSVPP